MRWLISRKIKAKTPSERREAIVKALLASRGIKTESQKKAFFDPPPPEKLTARQVGISVPGLQKAIRRVIKAIKNKEKIIVYGDYDADGICATAIVWEALAKLGAEVMPFIPLREEGYGLKSKRIDKFIKDGITLIITVDQGIVQNRQVAHAQKKGVDVIVTDHHQPGKSLPKAHAIVHTTRLAGVGVAWFFAQKLLSDPKVQTYFTSKVNQVQTLEFGLDLAAIGTVTDMVPLLGPNRSIVTYGIRAVRKTKRPGLLAIFEQAAINPAAIGTYEIGFLIGPRLNASGRMEDSMDALRLVCTHNKDRARDLAKLIEKRNQDRQLLTERTVAHARELWLKESGKESLIFVHHASYQEGVIGLVASKLMEEFFRPAVVLAEGAVWSKASARSIEGFNIIEAIRTAAADLGSHGGHPRAAGFSVETVKVSQIKKKLQSQAKTHLDPQKLTPALKVDAEVELADCTLDLYRKIQGFAPFGMDNPTPTFCSRGVEIVEIRPVGRDQKHLSLRLVPRSSKLEIRAIAFNLGHLSPKLKSGQTVDLAYQLSLNEWKGNKELQLKVRDISV